MSPMSDLFVKKMLNISFHMRLWGLASLKFAEQAGRLDTQGRVVVVQRLSGGTISSS